MGVTDFIHELRLSVRAQRALRMLGVDSVDKLLSLTRFDIVAQQGMGQSTWSEVRDVQSRFRGVPESSKVRAKSLAMALNEVLREDTRLIVVLVGGRVRIAEMT